MSHDILQAIWFLLVAVLFAGYFFLEGFDYGAGAVLPLLGKTNNERRLILNALGPIWDGNEVWLLTAGGAIFAAFPHWYASLFSGFYLALFLMLLALILRIVAFEYRSKKQDPVWQGRWDIILAISSALPGLLWGVAVSNLVFGVPVGADKQLPSTFFFLLEPWDLLCGISFLALFCYHGCLFIDIKTDNKALQVRIKQYAPRFFLVMLITLVLWLVCAFLFSGMFINPMMGPLVAFAKESPSLAASVAGTSVAGPLGLVALGLTLVAAVALLFSIFMFLKGRSGFAFLGTALAIALFTFAVFAGMFPNVLRSNVDPAFSLTIYNASSSAYTLTLMTIVAVCLVPVVLAYQIWTYWVFRKRLTEEDLKLNLDY